MEAGSKATKSRILWFIPILLLWAAAILPSSFQAVWGSFDDGVTLVMAQLGLKACFNMNAGRIFPVYHLHNWALYQIGGTNPAVWYFAQSLEILLVALLIYLAIGRLSGQWSGGALAAAVMLTSASIAENAYTISKSEPRIALFFAAAVLLVSVLLRRAVSPDSAGSRFIKNNFFCWAGLFLVVILAIFVKESCIAITALGIAGMLASIALFESHSRKKAIQLFAVMTIIFAAAASGLLILRAQALRITNNAYTAFTPDLRVSLRNLMAYLRQSSDAMILAVMCLLFGAVLLWHCRQKRVEAETERVEITVVMGWSTLAAGMAYLLLLVIWRGNSNYYMLPVATCVSISLGFFWGSKASMSRGGQGRLLRWAAGILLASVAATRLFSIPYLHFVATAQRSFDMIEDAVVREAVKSYPIHRRIIDIERPYFVEQPIQRNLLFRSLGAGYFSWIGGSDQIQQYSENFKRIFGATGPSPLQESPPNSGDLLVAQAGSYPFQIELRGIGPAVTDFSLSDQKVKKFESVTDLSLTKWHTFYAAWPVFQPWTMRKATLEFRSIVYECRPGKENQVKWEGRFGDGWIGNEAILHISEDLRSAPGLLRIQTIPYRWAVPIYVTLSGEKLHRIELNSHHLDGVVRIDELLPTRKGTIRIAASKTWVLKKFQPDSKETRALGVRVGYEAGGRERQIPKMEKTVE